MVFANESLHAGVPIQHWRGRSGRAYRLAAEPVESFALAPGQLHLLARGPMVLWVGSGEDLVLDPQSRARFRLALDCADRAFILDEDADPVARMTMIWDLQSAEPLPLRNAA